MIIVVGQGAPSQPPTGFDPLASKPTFESAWDEVLRQFSAHPMPNGKITEGKSWDPSAPAAPTLLMAWAADEATMWSRKVRIGIKLTMSQGTSGTPELAGVLEVSHGYANAWFTPKVADRWDGVDPSDVKRIAQEVGAGKQGLVNEAVFLGSLLSPIFEEAAREAADKTYKPDIGSPMSDAYLMEMIPGVKASVRLSGHYQKVAWWFDISLAKEGPGAVRADVGSLPFVMDRNKPVALLAAEVLKQAGLETAWRKRLIDALAPEAKRVETMLRDFLASAGFAPSAGSSSGLEINGDLVTAMFLEKRFFEVRGGLYDSKGGPVISVVSYDRTTGKKTEIMPATLASQVTPATVEEGLKQIGIRRTFEAKDEAGREAIDKVNQGDLLGAIQLMADLIDKRMEAPEFFQSYLAALQAANEGNKAKVADFINSL